MINKVKDMIFYNLKELIIFQLVFKVTSFLIFMPLFLNLFNIIMKVTGYNYLTLENIIGFIVNPLVIILLIMLILFMMMFNFFDLSTIIVLLDASYQKKAVDIKEALGISLKKSLQVFKINNLPLAFMLLFLIPFLNIGIASGFVSSISVPEFIMDYINNNILFKIIFWLIFSGLLIILLRWLYAIHYYVLENNNFRQARAKSIKLNTKNRLLDLIKMIVVQLIIFLLYIIFLFLGIAIIYLIYLSLKKIVVVSSIFITIIGIFLGLSLVIVALLSTPISYACMSALFYQNKIKSGEKIKHIQFNKIKKITISTVRWRRFKTSLVLCSVLTGSVFTYGLVTGRYNFNIEYIKKQEITAHRGSSIKYPENTMLAFVGALNEQANWIELDVQETKDDVLVVSHDNNLKRTTGKDINITDMNYDEIKEIDVGSYLNSNYPISYIPRLEDVIKWASSNNMKVNIELKPNGMENDLEEKVIALIKKYNFEDNCVVASGKYEVLEKVKEIDDDIKTAYVMSFFYGDIIKLDKVDVFSIEASSINNELVKKIHNNGKEIYAWTVNNSDSINKMLELNVDNIITDDVELAYRLLFKSRSSNLVFVYIKYVEKVFR
ncbi:MAG: glycerophosphoryl diester phosphodiesterase membrane domain-containing protein [bacterium]|nr:glycerophosphoryl diester phosphodiesterase membrane domain-containing protein [bacterium]